MIVTIYSSSAAQPTAPFLFVHFGTINLPPHPNQQQWVQWKDKELASNIIGVSPEVAIEAIQKQGWYII